MKIALAIILTAVVIGGGTYFFVNMRANTNSTALQNTVDQLNANLAVTQQELANASVVVNTNTTNTNSTSANTNSSVASAACTSAHLSATLANGQGTAGTYYYTLALKNTGTASCLYSGTTKVSLLNAAQVQVGTVSTTTANSLTIAAGKSIYASVGFPDATLYSNASACTAGVTSLAVYPPSQTTPVSISGLDTLYVGWTNYACSGFSVQAFSATQS